MLQLFSMSMISKLKSFQKFDSTNNCISLRRIVADIKCTKNKYAYWSKISRLQIDITSYVGEQWKITEPSVY